MSIAENREGRMEKYLDERSTKGIKAIYEWIVIGDGLGMLLGISLGVVCKDILFLGIGLVMGFGMILAIVPTIET